MKSICLLAVLSFSFVVCKAQQDLLWEQTMLNKYCAKFSLDEPHIPADTDLIAIWKMQEDVDEHNYFVVERYKYDQFVFTYMNRGGSNRTYENGGAFFSKIGNVPSVATDFINVGCYNRETNSMGYFFLKAEVGNRGWDITLSLVADTTLKDITSREALRERFARNLNNPHFYKQPVHFHKKLPLMYCK